MLFRFVVNTFGKITNRSKLEPKNRRKDRVKPDMMEMGAVNCSLWTHVCEKVLCLGYREQILQPQRPLRQNLHTCTHARTHKKYDLWEQGLLNCVGYITSTQAGRALLQLAQSKAGWINWSGSCANEVRSLLSPLVLLGQIIWAHLSWWISGCEWNGLVECHCAFTPLTSMTPSRGDEGAALRWEKLWQLYLSLANGHLLLSSCIPWRVVLIHSSGGFHIPSWLDD